VERAWGAFKSNDQAAIKDCLDRLGQMEPGWNQQSKEAFGKLRKAEKADFMHHWRGFKNVLARERGFARDSLSIRPRESKAEGNPLLRFVRLEAMRPSPAAPDRELAFKVDFYLGPGKDRWDVAQIIWLIREDERRSLENFAKGGGLSAQPGEHIEPAVLVANSAEVRRIGKDPFTLPFPSGVKTVAPSSAGVLALDWDNDLRTDLVLAGAGGVRFYQQEANGKFGDVSAKTKLPAEVLNGDYYGAWTADLEMDGDLDIVLARRTGAPVVLRNNGDGTFKAIEPFGGVKEVRAFVWADLDNDGAPDAAFLDAAGQLHVFANERSLQFMAWPVGPSAANLVALTAADVNDDGVIDLAAVKSSGSIVHITQSQAGIGMEWTAAELARSMVAADAAAGTVLIFVADLDNNGAMDLIVAGRDKSEVFLADGAGKLDVLPALELRAAAALDLDQDGRLDLVGLSAEGRPVRAVNQGKKGYRYQTIWPLANTSGNAGDNRINSFGVGGEIEIRAGMLVQKQLVHGPVVHFGLGEQPAADVVRIVWPNGLPQWEFPQLNREIAADKAIAAGQRLSGSCPFLFTFNGTGMRFAGDFMWGTPLGMYVNGQNVGDFPQTTEWLKIPGPHLVPKDGHYDVRVHANLWEVDYFDQLALIVVDHPADTEIHVDERFFLTPTKPRLHVTTPARPIARACDHHGNDATDDVRAIDGRYLARAGLGRFQGLTQDHWVEIDLGDDAPREGPVLLIARGWLQPTNSSINVALSQGSHEIPRPLALEVPDGKGGWKVADPALGFPAGKDKTLIIRLDGLAGKSGVTRRFRLRTNMEIYWDFLGYAVELDSGLAKLQRPAPVSAELRYRGMLQMTRKDRTSPELPIYDKVHKGQQPWRDLTGFYTRYGDVKELLEKVDDRYVIANAGDEIAFRFAVPAGPEVGFKRDFIWECDGWTRDGDLNTKHGNSVLPLPMHGKKTDDARPGLLEVDPVYRLFPRDWETYHTRHVTGADFARGLRR
jgi:hypothetical protein